MGSDDEWLADGLDGAERQAVAAGLWRAWRSERRMGAVLTGLSGHGKSMGVVVPLMERAAAEGIQSVLLEVPLGLSDGMDRETELLDQLQAAIVDNDVAVTIDLGHGFFPAVQALLKAGVLVVVDEFQRLLGPDGRPLQPFADELPKRVKRTNRSARGALWLVSTRVVDPAWTEPFHVAELPSPPDQDAIEIVLHNMSAGIDADSWFPVDQRSRTVARLGRNPRVLRLLGKLLGKYALDDLLDPVGEPTDPENTQLVEAIERDLMEKALEGLSDTAARRALESLAVLDGWADADLREAMIGHLGDSNALVRELLDRYLLESHPGLGRASYKVHPVVREVDPISRRRDESAWYAAHRRAGA